MLRGFVLLLVAVAACDAEVLDPVIPGAWPDAGIGGSGGTQSVCGDDKCNGAETPAICPWDCGTCGNGNCDPDEDFTTCPEDGCTCDNGMCDSDENQLTCPGDCGAVAIATGREHSCVVLADGTARCWGDNSHGQVGDGQVEHSPFCQLYHRPDCSQRPVRVSGLTGVVSVSAGFVHSCATLADGSAWCWGGSGAGVLGDGVAHDADCHARLENVPCSTVPVQVSGLTDATAVAAGGYHTCALRSDGTAWCWGWNDNGQLGDSTTAPSPFPVQVLGVSDALALAAGGRHTCAVQVDGAVWCWGSNYGGQLGNGTTVDSALPVQVAGLSDAIAVSTGGLGLDSIYITCALRTDGTVWCWGTNPWGLGNGGTSSSVPVQVTGVSDAVGISAGGTQACAVTSGGNVWCWGNGYEGQLGGGVYAESSVPVQVLSPPGAVAVAAGGTHSCAMFVDGAVWCWGDGAAGQHGDGDTAARNVPDQVAPW